MVNSSQLGTRLVSFAEVEVPNWEPSTLLAGREDGGGVWSSFFAISPKLGLSKVLPRD
jgi:hypothetical protein